MPTFKGFIVAFVLGPGFRVPLFFHTFTLLLWARPVFQRAAKDLLPAQKPLPKSKRVLEWLP